MAGVCCPGLSDPTPLLFWCAVVGVCGLALLAEAAALWMAAPAPRATGRRWVARALVGWRPWLALPLLAMGFWSLGLALASAAVYWTFGQDGRYTPGGGDPDVAAHVGLALGLFARLGMPTVVGAAVLLAGGWLALSLTAARANVAVLDR
ncbi:MAG TPA: hypothetical protein VID73_12685 [Ktedonobacterales bacterium]|jgi:hypothetical protein